VPKVVVLVVVTVIVTLPDPPVTVDEGENVHCGGETELGVSEQERLTLPVKPFSAVMLTVEVAEPP